MTVRDQEHVYHEVKDIFDVYIFGFEGFGIYYTDGGRDILLGRYATQEKAEMVLGEMFLTYRDIVKGQSHGNTRTAKSERNFICRKIIDGGITDGHSANFGNFWADVFNHITRS